MGGPTPTNRRCVDGAQRTLMRLLRWARRTIRSVATAISIRSRAVGIAGSVGPRRAESERAVSGVSLPNPGRAVPAEPGVLRRVIPPLVVMPDVRAIGWDWEVRQPQRWLPRPAPVAEPQLWPVRLRPAPLPPATEPARNSPLAVQRRLPAKGLYPSRTSLTVCTSRTSVLPHAPRPRPACQVWGRERGAVSMAASARRRQLLACLNAGETCD